MLLIVRVLLRGWELASCNIKPMGLDNGDESQRVPPLLKRIAISLLQRETQQKDAHRVWQVGKSKVFMKETLQTELEQKAAAANAFYATKIASHWRRYYVRQEYIVVRELGLELQKLCKAVLARYRFHSEHLLPRNAAALCIQTCWRHYYFSKASLIARNAVQKITRAWLRYRYRTWQSARLDDSAPTREGRQHNAKSQVDDSPRNAQLQDFQTLESATNQRLCDPPNSKHIAATLCERYQDSGSKTPVVVTPQYSPQSSSQRHEIYPVPNLSHGGKRNAKTHEIATLSQQLGETTVSLVCSCSSYEYYNAATCHFKRVPQFQVFYFT